MAGAVEEGEVGVGVEFGVLHLRYVILMTNSV
jgi:hypothetical protein